MISLNERKIIENIKKSNLEGQKSAIKKLIIVSIICCLFMAAEVVGGIFSGSLAILSDAAHMLSDFSGFAISMLSIVISRNKPTYKLSYGYHRAEILGALCSILLIWGLTIWLIYEASMKIYLNEKVTDPLIMLIVAIFGLISNLVMGHVLHSAGGHHHGHSHGHSHENHKEHKNDDHHDGHNHEHTHDKHKHVETKKNDKHKKKAQPVLVNNVINNVSLANESALTEQLIDNNNITSDKINDYTSNFTEKENRCQNDHHIHENKKFYQEQKNKDHNDDDHHKHETGHNHTHDKNHHCQNDNQVLLVEKKIKSSNKHKHKHSETDHCHDHENDHDHDHSQYHNHDNLNIRAAFIHVIGDLIQSIGVVIAAIVIMIWPEYDIIDPICTFVFSVIVVCTTIPILCDCIRVFMEGTPAGVDPDKILEDLHKVFKYLIYY